MQCIKIVMFNELTSPKVDVKGSVEVITAGIRELCKVRNTKNKLKLSN